MVYHFFEREFAHTAFSESNSMSDFQNFLPLAKHSAKVGP